MRDPKTLAAPLVLLLALAVMLNFVDRGAIGIAAPLMSKALGLSATRFGLAVSAFFWTYGLAQPFIGMAADRWSAGRVLAISVALWALATLLTGLAGSLAVLVVLRLVLGLGEAALFPATSKLIAAHVPAHRRGLANAVIAVGLALGPALGTLAGGMLLARLPGQAAADLSAQSAMPVGQLLRQRTLWVMGAAHALANYGFFFVAAWLPLYLVKSRGLTIPTMTLFATVTFAAQALASLGWGQLADALVRGGRRPAAVQRGLATIAQLGSIAGISGIALATGPGALLAALVVTGVFLGCLPTMVYALGQGYAGARGVAGWIGVQNAIGSVSGIIGPVVTGMIVDATGSFAGAFAFAAAISAVGAAMFAFALP